MTPIVLAQRAYCSCTAGILFSYSGPIVLVQRAYCSRGFIPIVLLVQFSSLLFSRSGSLLFSSSRKNTLFCLGKYTLFCARLPLISDSTLRANTPSFAWANTPYFARGWAPRQPPGGGPPRQPPGERDRSDAGQGNAPPRGHSRSPQTKWVYCTNSRSPKVKSSLRTLMVSGHRNGSGPAVQSATIKYNMIPFAHSNIAVATCRCYVLHYFNRAVDE